MEGTTIGQYRVVRKIGAGGMGAVYLAEHALVGRRAALIIGDCLGVGLTGCTLQIQPAPTLLEYAKNGMPSMTATSTDSTGYVIAYRIPVGVSSFAATCPTGPLRQVDRDDRGLDLFHPTRAVGRVRSSRWRRPPMTPATDRGLLLAGVALGTVVPGHCRAFPTMDFRW